MGQVGLCVEMVILLVLSGSCQTPDGYLSKDESFTGMRSWRGWIESVVFVVVVVVVGAVWSRVSAWSYDKERVCVGTFAFFLGWVGGEGGSICVPFFLL